MGMDCYFDIISYRHYIGYRFTCCWEYGSDSYYNHSWCGYLLSIQTKCQSILWKVTTVFFCPFDRQRDQQKHQPIVRNHHVVLPKSQDIGFLLEYHLLSCQIKEYSRYQFSTLRYLCPLIYGSKTG